MAWSLFFSKAHIGSINSSSHNACSFEHAFCSCAHELSHRHSLYTGDAYEDLLSIQPNAKCSNEEKKENPMG